MYHQIAQGLAGAVVILFNWWLAHKCGGDAATCWRLETEEAQAAQYILGLAFSAVVWLLILGSQILAARAARKFGIAVPPLIDGGVGSTVQNPPPSKT